MVSFNFQLTPIGAAITYQFHIDTSMKQIDLISCTIFIDKFQLIPMSPLHSVRKNERDHANPDQL